MNSWMKKIGLGLALGATALTVAAPADAQRFRGGGRGGYHGGYYRGGGGGAVLAGVAGLAVGAALASGPYYRGGYGYYGDPYYHDYYRGYGYGYYPRGCFIERRFDPYYGRPVHVRVCR